VKNGSTGLPDLYYADWRGKITPTEITATEITATEITATENASMANWFGRPVVGAWCLLRELAGRPFGDNERRGGVAGIRPPRDVQVFAPG
jgi:hypothetical protein